LCPDKLLQYAFSRAGSTINWYSCNLPSQALGHEVHDMHESCVNLVMAASGCIVNRTTTVLLTALLLFGCVKHSEPPHALENAAEASQRAATASQSAAEPAKAAPATAESSGTGSTVVRQ
jgi:hypothetical protein